jgi:hypothetical protein
MATGFQRKATAALVAVALMLSTGAVAPAAAPAKKLSVFNVLPIVITSVTPGNGGLVANGLVGSQPFSTPISLTPGAVPVGGTCPILNLSLGPINLQLLGLNVDTSSICLQITAIQGGGLLGDLLCGIANLLNTGLPLTDVLASLTGQQLALLSNGLTQVLNQAIFIPLSRSDALQAAECNILHLALGPIDLNLLGLRVQLTDCAQGPVVLDITATPGGGLPGDLLCGLSGLLQGNAAAKIADALQAIANLISALLG